MSKTIRELEDISNMRADFESFISQEKFDDAHAIIDNMGDLGFETEALFLRQAFNRATTEYARKTVQREDEEQEAGDIRDLVDQHRP
jgi:hypothetical protein